MQHFAKSREDPAFLRGQAEQCADERTTDQIRPSFFRWLNCHARDHLHKFSQSSARRQTRERRPFDPRSAEGIPGVGERRRFTHHQKTFRMHAQRHAVAPAMQLRLHRQAAQPRRGHSEQRSGDLALRRLPMRAAEWVARISEAAQRWLSRSVETRSKSCWLTSRMTVPGMSRHPPFAPSAFQLEGERQHSGGRSRLAVDHLIVSLASLLLQSISKIYRRATIQNQIPANSHGCQG